MLAEPPVDFTQQLCGGLKVNLRGTHIHVSHIRGEDGKTSVDVLAVPIPLQQSMDCEGVPQIVDPRPSTVAGNDAAIVQKLTKCWIHGGMTFGVQIN